MSVPRRWLWGDRERTFQDARSRCPERMEQDRSINLTLSIQDSMTGRWLLLAVLTPYVGWLVFAYEYHLIDGVNLAIHEAGHIIFGFFGQTAHFLGGTLAQLMFPAAFVGQFLYQGKGFDACVLGVWFCESLMYAAKYIADARVQALPLVGGHIHDWNWLLSRWGMLGNCQQLGTALHAAASLGAVGLLLTAAGLLLRGRHVRTS